MNAHLTRLVADVIEAYERYRTGQVTLPELQAVVEAVAGAVDSSDPSLLELLKWLCAELETVRFMWPEEEEKAEIAKRFDAFKSRL